LGKRLESQTSFYLIGGSALILLGASRETINIDSIIENSDKNIQKILKELSNEMRKDLEYVALDEFIPLPAKSEQRHHFIGRYGKVDAYNFDPYNNALSKLDRGFESDIEDVVFLIKQGWASLPQLEQTVIDAIPQAEEFDMNLHELQEHLQAVRVSIVLKVSNLRELANAVDDLMTGKMQAWQVLSRYK
jgi:hypothetical protein